MKLGLKNFSYLQSLIPKHRGVFSIHDLGNLFLTTNPLTLHRQLKPLLAAKILYRFCRGFYVAENFDLEWLSQRICPESALSLTTVLAKNLLIGSIPQKTVYAVKIGKSRRYRSEQGQVIHLGFASIEAKKLWFGYDRFEQGVRSADPEKAFLDTLYFHQSGHHFSFNIYSDIQLSQLNQERLEQYLARYKNPKFIKFVEGVMYGSNSIR